MSQQSKPSIQQTQPSNPADFLGRACVVYAGCFFPFLHKGFGVRALRAYVFCPVLMFFYSGFGNCPEILLYIPVWLLAIAYRRCTLDPRRHTRYPGYPWLAGLICKSESTACFLEALLCIGVGLLIMQVSEPLGQFVAFAGVPMLVMLFIEAEMINARAWTIHDAEIEAEHWRTSQE